MDLHKSALKDFILPKVKSVFVIDYYERLRSELKSRQDFSHDEILANPRVRTANEVTWSTDAFHSAPKRLSNLTGDEKERYSRLLNTSLHDLLSVIDNLKHEEGGKSFSDLLSKAVSNVEDSSVYCADNKVVIVNWGMIPRPGCQSGTSLYRSGKFLNNWDETYSESASLARIYVDEPETRHVTVDEPEVKAESSEAVIDTETQKTKEVHITANPEKPLTHEGKDSSDLKKEKPSDYQGTKEVGRQSESTSDGKSSDHSEGDHHPPEPQDSKSDDSSIGEKGEKSTDQTKSEKDSVNVSHRDDQLLNSGRNAKDKSESKDGKINSWRNFFGSLVAGIGFLFQKLWWILLLILALLALLFFTKDCQGPIHQVNPFYNPLPETSIILPIQDGAVGMSQDGMYRVATDRLNVMLEKEDDNTMLNWAKAFKKQYPSEAYRVVYYNPDLYTLQIQVPPEARMDVLNNLNQQLSDFSFDVYEEAVYEGEITKVNDPAMKDSNASWYFTPIDAFTAWDLSMGSESVIVAVVDNGFDLSHPELAGKIVKPYNVLTRNQNVRPIVTTEGTDPHGTHVAATAIGKVNNGAGLLGMAPNCKLMPIQVANDNPTGSMSSTAIWEGVMYAIDNGADVVNVSLGMYTPEQVMKMSEGQQLNYISSSFRQEELIWEKAFRKARERNCIIVFAAGNDDVVSGIDPKKRNKGTIRVSAVNEELGKADFSNFGRYPSLNRDYSTVSAPGVGIYSASPGNQYVYLQGTSMAAPIVTGTVALMKSANKNLSAEEAIKILQTTGREVNPKIGPLINAGEAVKAAMGISTNPKVKKELPTDCENIRAQVRRLQEQIDSLSQLCPSATEPNDTLKYEDAVRDEHGLDGTWKSTTRLISTEDNAPIELYMTFQSLKGSLSIVHHGKTYKAPLTASIQDNNIQIEQHGPARCSESEITFVPYVYKCKADRKGNLYCEASSPVGSVNFNLVKIK
ncbi:MAG: S8 family serine peptidase [Bacteroidales bacterium]|nr:S8 family serine peptidase [Bacteroidales bacterium]